MTNREIDKLTREIEDMRSCALTVLEAEGHVELARSLPLGDKEYTVTLSIEPDEPAAKADSRHTPKRKVASGK